MKRATRKKWVTRKKKAREREGERERKSEKKQLNWFGLRLWVHHSCENRWMTCVCKPEPRQTDWQRKKTRKRERESKWMRVARVIFFISILLEYWYGLSFFRGPHFGHIRLHCLSLYLCVHNESLCFYVVLWWANLDSRITRTSFFTNFSYLSHLHHCAFLTPDWYPSTTTNDISPVACERTMTTYMEMVVYVPQKQQQHLFFIAHETNMKNENKFGTLRSQKEKTNTRRNE